MASKVHFKRNATASAIACATDAYRNKGRVNQRASYRCVDVNGPQVVRMNDFRSVPAADRCAHCETAWLTILNRQQKERGEAITPVLWLA
jgi:hypothetical protein